MTPERAAELAEPEAVPREPDREPVTAAGRRMYEEHFDSHHPRALRDILAIEAAVGREGRTLDVERLATAMDTAFSEAGAGLRGLTKVCTHDAYLPLGDPAGDQVQPGDLAYAIAEEYARLAATTTEP